jgi:hypothetical protein
MTEQPSNKPPPEQPEVAKPPQRNGAAGEERVPAVSEREAVAGAASTKDNQKREWRWPQVLAAVGTAIIAIGGIYFGIEQIREEDRLEKETNRLQRAQLDSHLEEVMMNLDRYFASHSRLRPYFFAFGHPERFPSKRQLLAPAMGTAEMIIDFADDVGAYAEMRKMDRSDSARWREIVGGYFKESPVTRYMWKKLHYAYSTSTACILQAPIQPKKLRQWHWQTDTPREVARRCS